MKQNQEIWTPAKYITESGDIIDFTDLYLVSDQGNVKSLNYRHTGKEGILSQRTVETEDGSIFYTICLCKDGKTYHMPTHRLILSSFNQEGWFPNADVDHIDARTSTNCNNMLCNLRWFTRQQNSSTEHRKELLSKAHTNHPAKSKRVRVKNLTTGETTEYPSANEAGRALGIRAVNTPAVCINRCNGYYKKMNLQFSYID